MDTTFGLVIILLLSMGWAYWKIKRDEAKAHVKPAFHHQTSAKPSSKTDSSHIKKHHDVVSHHERPTHKRTKNSPR